MACTGTQGTLTKVMLRDIHWRTMKGAHCLTFSIKHCEIAIKLRI